MVLPETKPAISGSPESLLSGIASGNKSAEEELVRHYWRALYLMLFRDCHDHSMASDMAQEALCVCLVKARAGEIREAKALTSFVHRTATNLLIAHKRKEKRQKTEFTDDLDRLFGELDGPAQQCQREKIVALVAGVLNEMPVERDRDILVEYFVHGTSKDELCDLLSLSPEHFDRVLYRARQRLKQKLSLAISEQGSNLSLVSLLGCGLVVLLCGDTSPTTIADEQVRELQVSYHLSQRISNNITKDGVSDSSEGKEYDTTQHP